MIPSYYGIVHHDVGESGLVVKKPIDINKLNIHDGTYYLKVQDIVIDDYPDYRYLGGFGTVPFYIKSNWTDGECVLGVIFVYQAAIRKRTFHQSFDGALSLHEILNPVRNLEFTLVPAIVIPYTTAAEKTAADAFWKAMSNVKLSLVLNIFKGYRPIL